MKRDNTTREDNKEMNVQMILQQLGVAPAVEEFLGDNRINNLIHEVFSTGCLEIAEKIKTMPASIQKALNERLADFETGYDEYMVCCLDFFRTDLASRMVTTCEILSDASQVKIGAIYQEAMKEFDPSLMDLVRDLSEELFESGKEGFINSWIVYIEEVETEEELYAILDTVIGDKMPEMMMKVSAGMLGRYLASMLSGGDYDEDDDD